MDKIKTHNIIVRVSNAEGELRLRQMSVSELTLESLMSQQEKGRNSNGYKIEDISIMKAKDIMLDK